MNKYRTFHKLSHKEKQRIEFAKTHPAARCSACKSGGTLRRLDGKYLCTGCYNAVIEGRIQFAIPDGNAKGAGENV